MSGGSAIGAFPPASRFGKMVPRQIIIGSPGGGTMRWQGGQQSDNVEDVRGISPGMAIGGIGTLVILVLGLLLGADPAALLQQVQQVQVQQPGGEGGEQRELTAEEKESGRFASIILHDTEVVWSALFREMGREYRNPKMKLYSGQIRTGCGLGAAAMGPFYCPEDETVYLDTTFFDELATKFGAPGDFANAYVIAHEIGHHVQKQLGMTDKLQAARGRVSQTEYNDLSVRLELQADFYAGVWAYHANELRSILEPGDVEKALTAAAAIGDDRLQKQGQGYVEPDSFTHGTSAQRVKWFRKGLQTGDVRQGDTFGARDL